MTDHKNRAHALLSASGAERWLACPPSARLEDALPEQSSSYADEGRLAHEIAELKALKLTTLMKPSVYKKKLKKLQEHELYKPEMESCTDGYIEYLNQILHSFSEKPYTAIEKKVDYSAYVPEGFGTCDFLTIGDGTLYIVDYKHGQGVPVSAERNPQMMSYGLGAVEEYSLLYDIVDVHMTIFQPRLDTISVFSMPVTELLTWGESIKPIAQMAFEGKGEFCQGDHCRFCRAKAQCRVRADGHTALEDFGFAKSPLISDDEIGAILAKGRNLAKWLKDLEDYALGVCLQGGTIPGWKVVEGRSNRAFTNQEEAFKCLKACGWDEALLYKREPLTLSAVEDLIGKKDFADLLTPFVEKPPGKPKLAEDSDPREILKPISATDDFGGKQDF